MKQFVIATAGHVDHGKSSLVKALTGTDPDRLPEEKARQITIDLGFAELNLRGPNEEEIHAAIVDVPGHEDFVRNMIAGVGSIDLALFVVAADDGWMPQTEEHLQILTYLGINRAVIALTKIDIGEADRVSAEIREQLRDTNFSDSPIIPVSVPTNIGLTDLRDALAIELSKTQPQRDIGKPRLFVDRAFTLCGIGTIATGTLTGDTLQRGQTVLVQPRNISSRIRSIQNHGRDVDLARPGMRTAINLADLSAGDQINRGDVITVSGFEPNDSIDVILERSPRLRHASPIKNGAFVYLHHGTKRVRATIWLRPGRELARLKLDQLILAFLGDRFVIRDPSERQTIAGGIVSNGAPPNDVDLCALATLSRDGPANISTLLKKSHFSYAEVDGALQRLHRDENIFLGDNVAIAIEPWRKLRARAAELIDTHHVAHPESVGMELNELRARLPNTAPDVFDELIADLSATDFARVRSIIARRAHQPALPEKLRVVAERILAELAQKPFDPPNQTQMDDNFRAAIRFLIERGDMIELAPSVIVRQEAFAQMKMKIENFIAAHGPASVSQLREQIGTSRRIMVPLLELLDRQRVTRRMGDKRMLA